MDLYAAIPFNTIGALAAALDSAQRVNGKSICEGRAKRMKSSTYTTGANAFSTRLNYIKWRSGKAVAAKIGEASYCALNAPFFKYYVVRWAFIAVLFSQSCYPS